MKERKKKEEDAWRVLYCHCPFFYVMKEEEGRERTGCLVLFLKDESWNRWFLSLVLSLKLSLYFGSENPLRRTRGKCD